MARRGKGRQIIGAVTAVVAIALGVSLTHIEWFGGHFAGPPTKLDQSISPKARALIEAAYEGVDPSKLLDIHVHLLGQDWDEKGALVHPLLFSWAHPLRRLHYELVFNAAGLGPHDASSRAYFDRLDALVQANPRAGTLLLLPLDGVYDGNGRALKDQTLLFTPNDLAQTFSQRDPSHYRPAASIHPARKDALQQLAAAYEAGIRVIKWLPNVQHIYPADQSVVPFYKEMARRHMILLTHGGDERAVEAGDQSYGNPLWLQLPLTIGVTVVVAHCASLGTNPDLDDPNTPEVRNFDLFLRMMDDPRWVGKLYGEISGLTLLTRQHVLARLLERDDLGERFLDGSDYPLPAVNSFVSTAWLAWKGYIDADERRALNEIYQYNPLLFDFVLKRTLRHPTSGRAFPPRLFEDKLGLVD